MHFVANPPTRAATAVPAGFMGGSPRHGRRSPRRMGLAEVGRGYAFGLDRSLSRLPILPIFVAWAPLLPAAQGRVPLRRARLVRHERGVRERRRQQVFGLVPGWFARGEGDLPRGAAREAADSDI